MSDAAIRGLTLALLAVLGVFCLLRLELTHSITHFLPSEDEAELVDLTLELVDSPLSRRMVLAIGGGEPPERRLAAAALAGVLRSHPEVDWLETGLDEEAMRSLYELYFERRVYLASDTPRAEIPALLEPAALARQAAHLRQRLAQPVGSLLARTAPADPLGLFERILERVRTARPALSRSGGSFTSADGEHAILLLGLRSSPFDSSRQGPLLDEILRQFERLDGSASLRLEQSGVNRLAVASERRVRGDLDFISVMAVTGVCSLFLFVFRSPRHLLIAILTPLAGFAAAIAVAVSGSAPVHGITVAFGFVLIGVAIDYPIHIMNHRTLASPGSPAAQGLQHIRSSLLASGLTTTTAFATLALSDFPGLGEMGRFAAVGVPVALALAIFSVPAFLGPVAVPTPAQVALSRACVRGVAWLGARRRLARAIPAALLALAAAGLPRIHWQDDPSGLMAADPELLEEDRRVREMVADVDGGRFVVGLATSREAALALNDRIHQRLQRLVSDGELEATRSLHSALWSEALQRENLAAFRAEADLAERIDQAFTREGFRPGAFASFGEAVSAPSATPLRPEDLVGSPLARALDSLAELDGRWAIVTYLRGVRSNQAVAAALAGLPGAHLVDQGEIVARLYQGYRRSTLRMLALGSLAVFLVLQLRYRSLRRGLLAFAPSALVSLATLGLFGLLGGEVNVVSAISLVVVLGMGVDYGVFSVDAAGDPGRLGATLTSLLVSCLTTLFVFGTLALSEQPVLHAIGLVTGTGILLALLLSPAVCVLAAPNRP